MQSLQSRFSVFCGSGFHLIRECNHHILLCPLSVSLSASQRGPLVLCTAAMQKMAVSQEKERNFSNDIPYGIQNSSDPPLREWEIQQIALSSVGYLSKYAIPVEKSILHHYIIYIFGTSVKSPGQAVLFSDRLPI